MSDYRKGKRPLTESLRRQRERLAGRRFPPTDRPKYRSECIAGPRPCPYVGCRYHLYIEVTNKGSIKYNQPQINVWELDPSCSLDVAQTGPQSLSRVGRMLSITRERARQLEANAIEKMASLMGDAYGFRGPDRPCSRCRWFTACDAANRDPSALFCWYQPTRFELAPDGEETD